MIVGFFGVNFSQTIIIGVTSISGGVAIGVVMMPFVSRATVFLPFVVGGMIALSGFFVQNFLEKKRKNLWFLNS